VKERLDVPVAVQLVLENDREWRHNGRVQRVISADRWLTLLP
jgi:hypothetical protein